MTDGNHDEMDRALDAALTRYAAEPRAGLEERVLANLRAETARGVERAWWRWGALAFVAAALLIAVGLTERLGNRTHPTTHVAVAAPTTELAGTKIATSREPRAGRTHVAPVSNRTAKHRAPNAALVAAQPKLDQFPSPRPLSDQEKLLLDYVERFPEEAARVAEAQTALAQREQLEMYGPPAMKPQGDEKTE